MKRNGLSIMKGFYLLLWGGMLLSGWFIMGLGTTHTAPADSLASVGTVPLDADVSHAVGSTPTVRASGGIVGGISDPDVILTPPELENQGVNVPFSDPVFGTTLRRLAATTGDNFTTHIYSQLQAFSPDNEYLLLIENGDYVVRRVDNLSLVTGFDTTLWNAPRWHPTLPHTMVHYDGNDDTTVRFLSTDVSNGQTVTVYAFPALYERVLVAPSHEELSRNGRWLTGMLLRNDGEATIVTLDLQSNTLGAQFTVNGLYDSGPCVPDPTWGNVEPDWVGVSPLGNYLVVQWQGDGIERCNGLETFDLVTGAFVGRPYDGHQHGDLGVLADGVTEVFVTFELYHPSGNLAIGYRTLPGPATVGEPTYLQVMDWQGEHISCQGLAGVCLVTTWADEGNGWQALEGELFLQYLDGSVLRLVHHRSTGCGYWVQPRASLSANGRRVIFASDWGEGACSDGNNLGAGDAYVVDLYEEGGGNPDLTVQAYLPTVQHDVVLAAAKLK